MGAESTTAKQLRLDERTHVEKPLLDQLAGLGWEVIDLTDMKQTPADTHRESFTEVVMPPVLRERLKVINPWIEAGIVDRGMTLAWEVVDWDLRPFTPDDDPSDADLEKWAEEREHAERIRKNLNPSLTR